MAGPGGRVERTAASARPDAIGTTEDEISHTTAHDPAVAPGPEEPMRSIEGQRSHQTARTPWTTRLGALGTALALCTACLLPAGSAMAQTVAAAPPAPSPPSPIDPWPRQVQLPDAAVLVYQPQVSTWAGDVITFRAAVAIRPAGGDKETFGVIWATARTQVDRVARMVVLHDLTVTRSNFPTLPDNGARYLQALKSRLRPGDRMIALDRLEASLAAAGSVKASPVAVSNVPPRIIVSETPAILVPVDGAAVIRPVPNSGFERVINTRALIMRRQGDTTFYLHVYDGWLYAGSLTDPWLRTLDVPPGMEAVAQSLAKAGQVDLLDGAGVTPRPSLTAGAPAIYVSQAPAELIVFRGAPTYTPISGTSMEWASNTSSDVIWNGPERQYYVLLAGRWYRAAYLTGVAWTFVPSASLPADFRRIPANEPAGVVRVAVAGTPEAEEAVIANSIPQTATVPRVGGPTFAPQFDGPPQFRPIEGTALTYAVNSPTPIIVVSPNAYYALRAGVWYSATTVAGPWYVAVSVPAVIYTIPPTSPLHYVTYVQVYGSTAKVVYVGYTPGYLGTVVTPDGVVVYGTGYVYSPWIGTVWYPPPVTYGVMAQPVYNPAVGMAFGFAMGVTTAAISASYYHPAYYGYPCCGTTSYNVYGAYGSTTWSGTRSSYSNAQGFGQSSSGTYTNYGTGTTGSYEAGRGYNANTGDYYRNFGRTFDTTGGTTGAVEHGTTYDPSTGRYSHTSNAEATGPAGTQVTSHGQTGPTAAGGTETQHSTTVTNPNTNTTRTSSTTAGVGPQGAGVQHQSTYTNANTGGSVTTKSAAGVNSQGSASGREATYTNPTTGTSKTYGVGHEGNTLYADDNGTVYKNSGDGWQQHTSNGWQNSSTTPSWANSEQQARTQGDNRVNSLSQGASSWSSRFSGSGSAGSLGSRFGGASGGGWGDRFGESGGFGGRFRR